MAVPANLTPGDETGLGRWRFEDFTTAMRTGKRRDGRMLDALMPRDVYGAMSDDEVNSIWSSLRSLPPRKFGAAELSMGIEGHTRNTSTSPPTSTGVSPNQTFFA